MKKIGLETIFGGLFGIIAITSAIVEMALNGFTSVAIFGGLKDIAGTMVAVMVFVIAAKSLLPQKVDGFIGIFEEEMKKVETKYAPLLRRAGENGDEKRTNKLSAVVRYELSTSINALIDGNAKSYATFCEFNINKPENVSFVINKTTFMGRSSESFDTLQEMLCYKMASCLIRKFPNLGNGIIKSDTGFVVNFGHTLSGKDDAVMLAELVDCVTLLYIAECKK